jgi:prevent-host-death family protein
MLTVNVHEAKSTLSKLLAAVERGEEVTIARAGKPVARLVAVAQVKPRKRKLGWDKGKVIMLDNFDDPMDDEFMEAFR